MPVGEGQTGPLSIEDCAVSFQSACAALISVLPRKAWASELTMQTRCAEEADRIAVADTVFDGDGMCVVISVWDAEPRETSHSQVYSYYDAKGTLLWEVTLTAVYTYNGLEATCTDARCSVEFFDDHFYLVSETASGTGDSACATVKIGKQVFGSSCGEETFDLSLSCTPEGNVS